jgi:HTH-type transcriptional regulator/antitoxin HigA
VALVFIEHFPRTGVSGAIRWISDRPVIQLRLYYRWADIFWFNLYHELGHLVLHGKKDKFIEFDEREYAPERIKEDEADKFASDALVPPKPYVSFLAKGDTSPRAISEFAEQLGIHPGIVAGRLCHDRHVDWKSVSTLRDRLRFVPE